MGEIKFGQWVVISSLFFRWYDLWVGAYWDRAHATLYVCPVPTLGIKLCWWREDSHDQAVAGLSDEHRERVRLTRLTDLELCQALVDSGAVDEFAVSELMRRVRPNWMFELSDGTEASL